MLFEGMVCPRVEQSCFTGYDKEKFCELSKSRHHQHLDRQQTDFRKVMNAIYCILCPKYTGLVRPLGFLAFGQTGAH